MTVTCWLHFVFGFCHRVRIFSNNYHVCVKLTLPSKRNGLRSQSSSHAYCWKIYLEQKHSLDCKFFEICHRRLFSKQEHRSGSNSKRWWTCIKVSVENGEQNASQYSRTFSPRHVSRSPLTGFPSDSDISFAWPQLLTVFVRRTTIFPYRLLPIYSPK